MFAQMPLWVPYGFQDGILEAMQNQVEEFGDMWGLNLPEAATALNLLDWRRETADRVMLEEKPSTALLRRIGVDPTTRALVIPPSSA